MLRNIAYAGCLGVIGIISTEFGIIGILPQVASHYNIRIDQAGILLSAFALTIFLTGPFTVLFTSHINRKRIIVASISLFFVSNIISTFAPPFWLLFILRVVPAVLHPVFFSAVMGIIIRSARPNEQHRLMGIIMGGIAAAQVTVIPLSAYISSLYGWQISFIVQSILSLIAIGGISIFIPNLPVGEVLSYRSQLRILKKPRFRW